MTLKQTKSGIVYSDKKHRQARCNKCGREMPTITQKNKDLLTADNGDFICPKCHIDRTGGAHEGKAKKSKEKQGELDQQIAEELTHDVAADSIQSDEVEAISDRDTEQKDSFQT